MEAKNNITDPRIYNNPLPNDSKIVYEYGSAVYISDCYPNFIWHNGFWYKASADLKFERMTHPQIIHSLFNYYPLPNNDYSTTFENYILDDSFYPVLYANSQRIFVKEIWYNSSQSKCFNKLVIYYPSTQTFDIKDSNVIPCYSKYKLEKESSAIFKYEYNDEYMKSYLVE